MKVGEAGGEEDVGMGIAMSNEKKIVLKILIKKKIATRTSQLIFHLKSGILKPMKSLKTNPTIYPTPRLEVLELVLQNPHRGVFLS